MSNNKIKNYKNKKVTNDYTYSFIAYRYTQFVTLFIEDIIISDNVDFNVSKNESTKFLNELVKNTLNDFSLMQIKNLLYSKNFKPSDYKSSTQMYLNIFVLVYINLYKINNFFEDCIFVNFKLRNKTITIKVSKNAKS